MSWQFWFCQQLYQLSTSASYFIECSQKILFCPIFFKTEGWNIVIKKHAYFLFRNVFLYIVKLNQDMLPKCNLFITFSFIIRFFTVLGHVMKKSRGMATDSALLNNDWKMISASFRWLSNSFRRFRNELICSKVEGFLKIYWYTL